LLSTEYGTRRYFQLQLKQAYRVYTIPRLSIKLVHAP
jgi:hypothetical protein